MRALTLPRLAVTAALAVPVALSLLDCHAKTYVTCTGLCESVLPPCSITGVDASTPYDQCIAFCNEIHDKCAAVGRPEVFISYIECATDAGFSCPEPDAEPQDAAVDARDATADVRPDVHPLPVANAPCGLQQAELIQCESFDGIAPFDVADGAYAAGMDCPDASSCLACCDTAYPAGAKAYREAVNDCVCGDGGLKERICDCVDDAGALHACTPAEACASSACSNHPTIPASGDACDRCLANLLNEQMSEAGPCVVPVTRECDKSGVDCAVYMNCVSQPGCTN